MKREVRSIFYLEARDVGFEVFRSLAPPRTSSAADCLLEGCLFRFWTMWYCDLHLGLTFGLGFCKVKSLVAILDGNRKAREKSFGMLSYRSWTIIAQKVCKTFTMD